MTPLPASEIEAALATLQVADSFFPSGLYAHSGGIEGMVRRHLVRSADDVEKFIRGQLEWVVAPSDGVALLLALQARDVTEIVETDRTLFASKLPREQRNASTSTGRRFLTEAPSSAHWLLDQYRVEVLEGRSPGTMPVVHGVLGHANGVAPQLAFAAYCHGYAVSVLRPSLRLLQMTHRDGQVILAGLRRLVSDLFDQCTGRPISAITAFSPMLDLVAIGHENDDLRQFAS